MTLSFPTILKLDYFLLFLAARRDGFFNCFFLENKANKPIAEAEVRQIVEEIRARWEIVEGIAIIQRIGRLYRCKPTIMMPALPRTAPRGGLKRPDMALIV
jgi:hypothetical protein